VPLVVNDLAVLREVLSFDGKPAALFVDAADSAKLSAAVSRVLTDEALSQELRRSARGLRSRDSVKTMVEE
jgi:UDP:flavonoid glycosyltransferase YjiC (YdhE family)